MKKCIAVLLLACGYIWFVSVISYAADIDVYVFSNGGGGGKSDSANAGLELGLLLPMPDSKLGYLFGGGASWTPKDESLDEGYQYSLKRGDEWEPYFAFGVRPIIRNLYLVGTVGGSFQETKETWWGIEDVKDTEGHFTASGQVRYVWKHLMVGGGYHNRRGVIGGLGIVW